MPCVRGCGGTRLARAAAILGTLAALLLVPLPNNYRALWFGAATDFLHVPIFAAVVYAFARFCWPEQIKAIVVLAAFLATAAEILQPLVGRSASWRDLAYGSLGILIAVIALQRTWPFSLRCGLIAVAILWPLRNTAPVVIDAADAWNDFPVLADFQGTFSSCRWRMEGAELKPSAEGAILELGPRKRTGSGIILLPVVRDWTGYERLELEFSFTGEPLLFLISVRDGKRLPPELPRFDLWRRYDPGTHHVQVNLRDLEVGGDFPPIELDRVQSLHLIGFDDQPRTLVLGPIRLAGKKPRAF